MNYNIHRSTVVNLSYSYPLFNKKAINVLEIREMDGFDQLSIQNLIYNKKYPVYLIDLIVELLTRLVQFDSLIYDNKNNKDNTIDNILEVSGEHNASNDLFGKENQTFYPTKISKVKRDLIKQLTVGDRNLLLLQLQRLMFGEILHCQVNCSTCKKTLSVSIPVPKLIVYDKNSTDGKMEHHIKINNYALRLKPLTGKDQENLIQNNYILKTINNDKNIDAGKPKNDFISTILSSCILSSSPELPDNFMDQPDLIDKILKSLETLEPQGNIIFEIHCNLCNTNNKIHFMIDEFFIDEILYQSKRSIDEIHTIAMNYHWSEKEILRLPISRRKKYVELITNAFETQGDEL